MLDKTNTAVLLGLFDSVHLGHIKTLDALKQTGAKRKIVYTFKLAGVDTKGKRVPLISDEQKEELLLKNGADEVVSDDFSDVRHLSPEEFVDDILIHRLGADMILCGENFRFGRYAAGDTNTLEKLCKERGVGLKVIPLERLDGEVISTTRIRALLEKGDIETANRLLSRSYCVSGEIIHGNAFGREMGIRTINLYYEGCLKDGVYATITNIDGKSYKSVTDIGFKPTVSDSGKRCCETHILDFSCDSYGKTATVEFLEFYRDEQKFDNTHDLIETIKNDINRRKGANK